MKRLFSLIFILNLLKVNAQDIDSLMNVANKLTSDTDRVNLFYKEGFKLRNKYPQFAFECANIGLVSAIKSDSQKHLAKIYNLLGVIFYKKGDYKTALGYHQKALRLRKECHDVLGIAHSQTNLGNVYSDLKLFARAEAAYLNAMESYRQLSDKEKVVSCLLNIGTIKHSLKQYDAAIQNYSVALEWIDANNYETKASLLTNIGEAFIGKGMIEKGIAYNEDALKLRMMIENNTETADNYLNLGGIYIFKKEYDKAKFYIDTAMFIANKYDYADVKYKARKIYAIYFSEIKNFELAFYWLRKYNDLGDTILIQQNISQQFFDFNEQENLKPEKDNELIFPYLFFNVLIAMAILIGLFIFKFKR